MRTIRDKISRPFLAIIILMPIGILLIFNIIVSFYTRAEAEKDLQNAVAEITNTISWVESEYGALDSVTGNRPRLEAFMEQNQRASQSGEDLPSITNIIRNQSHSTSAELVVFDKNGELSQIFATESFVTDELAQKIYGEASLLEYNEIGTVDYDGDRYYIIDVEYTTVTPKAVAPTNKVVYISKGLIIDEFVQAVNVVLIVVSVIITLLALMVSYKVTNSIAKPIEKLTAQVEGMKSNEILLIDNGSDSVELIGLTTEINALNKRIYQYDQSQKNFLQNASHELRTPLMSIQGYADGIEMGVFADAKGTARLISDQCKRLTKLVDSLLSLARAENFSSNNKLERINLSQSIHQLLNCYKGYGLSENIEVKTDITEDIYILGNGELLQGSVGNILSNAIRYAQSRVEITVATVDNKAVITIKDDGKGIENPEIIFDRFVKGSDGNFGIGLSIAKTSLEMMKADIEVYNNGGAVFKITTVTLG